MRELKFRAWDKERKVWLDPADFLVTSEGTVLLHDIEYGAKYGNLAGKWREDEDDRIELVRFTGLHDKNGKEIYEGDVFPSKKGNWIVKFGDWLYWDGKKLVQMYGWYAECVTVEGKSHAQLPLYASQVEVIGNIYESPELLTNLQTA